MKIGTRISANWLNSESDEELRFLKQIGVDYLSVPLDAARGQRGKGSFETEDLRRFVDRLDAIGLKIGRASAWGSEVDEVHLGLPGGQQQIENICKTVEMLGEVGVPVLSIRCLWAEALVKQRRPGWTNRQGRGEYKYPAFSLDALQGINYEPEMHVTADHLWSNLINIYRHVIPVAERVGVKLAMHGNDPPVYWACGNPQILCRFVDFDRLFVEVPSPNNGMTFCVGTRYESGEDIFKGIEHFGQQGKICYVDFRNVRGTILKTGGYEEVFVDDGDINMGQVIRALHKVGYEGVIDVDHVIQVSGDTLMGHRYIAFAAGYIRGLLDCLR